jgi:hypothetical protein
MRPLALVVCLLAVAFCSGCFQHTIRVTVKADGSGSIAVRQVISKATLANLQQQKGTLPGFDEARIKREAVQYGPDVQAVIVKEVNQADGQGYLAVYQFPDINRVHIPAGKEPFRFTYRKGELTVNSPRPPAASRTPAPTNAADESGSQNSFAKLIQAMGSPYGFSGDERPDVVARRILQDLKISIELDLPEGTTTSQATHRDEAKKSRIRLIQVDGEMVASKPAAVDTLLKADGRVPVEILLSGLPGVRIEPKAKLTFKLQ